MTLTKVIRRTEGGESMKAVKRKEREKKKKGKEVVPAFYMIRGVRRYIGIGVGCPPNCPTGIPGPQLTENTSIHTTVPIIARPHPATVPAPAPALQPSPVRRRWRRPVPSSGVAGRWPPPVGTPPYCPSRSWPPSAPPARRSCSCCTLTLQHRRGHRHQPELGPALEPEPHERAAADGTVPASRGSSSL